MQSDVCLHALSLSINTVNESIHAFGHSSVTLNFCPQGNTTNV